MKKLMIIAALVPCLPIVAAGFVWWFIKAAFAFGQDCAIRGLK